MQFLAHRANFAGADRLNENTFQLLIAAFRIGFGVETDVRDGGGALVIAHDEPPPNAPLLAALLAEHAVISPHSMLALNIKADGLSRRLSSLLREYRTTSYFCFDMSVPETLAYRRDGLRFFTRESEYEREPVLYADAAGVWIDQFHSDWIRPERIRAHLDAGKEVALVSPDLHGRPHLPFWATLKQAGLAKAAGLMLCTDFASAALEFFHE